MSQKAAFVNIYKCLIHCQLVFDRRPSNSYSTLVTMGGMGKGITVRTDIFLNRENLNCWINMLNIQEKEVENEDLELKFVKNKEKTSGEKRKAEDGEEEEGIENGKNTFYNRSIRLKMSNKEVGDDGAEKTAFGRCVEKEPKIDSNNIRYSNHMKDNVQSYCQICKVPQNFSKMRSHTKAKHRISITDYKKKYGELIDNIVETVYHKCGICKKAILLDGDILATHARLHRISHKAYSDKYITLRKQEDKKCIQKMTESRNQTQTEADHTDEADENSPSPDIIKCSVDRYKDLSGHALADKLLAELDVLLKRYA